jgi:hypothetical protein
MTYRVVVANEWRNIVVTVDANDPRSASEIAKWIVENRKHGNAHGIPQDERMEVERGSYSRSITYFSS